MGSTNKHIHYVPDSPTLQSEVTKQQRAEKSSLIQHYHSFAAQPGESLTNLYGRFTTLINNLKLFGKTYDNDEMNLKFMRALPNKWFNITTAIKECNDLDDMPLQKLFDKLNKYELRDQKDALIWKYHQFNAKPGESVTEMFDRFNSIVNDLRLFGRICDNYEVNIKFLLALPSSWDSRAVAIRECNDMDAMTLEKLYEKLRTYEMRDRYEVLIREYHKFTAEPGESITEIYDRFNRLVNDLRLLGRTCDNDEVNLKLLKALPISWDKWAVPIRECNDMNAMPLEVLYGKLKTYILEDQQRKESRQNYKYKGLVEDGVDSDNSDMCSHGQTKLRSKLYTTKH